jgi:hypothetical protein
VTALVGCNGAAGEIGLDFTLERFRGADLRT